jgi:cytochrome P450
LTDVAFDQVVLTPEYLEDPYPFYAELRSEQPVYWSEAVGAWLLTRYDDVTAGLRDQRLGSGTRIKAYVRQMPQDEQERFNPISDHISTWVGMSDPPDHTRLRALVDRVFTARMIAGLRPRIQEITDELLGERLNEGRMDVVADLAFLLPVIVICEMLGLPAGARGEFKRWSNDIAGFMGTGQPQVDLADRAQRSMYEMKEFLGEVFEQRLRDPEEDLISSLVAAEREEDRLTQDELFGMCVQLLVAGHETTMGLISNGLLALLRDPDQMDALRSEPRLIITAVEEFLRYDSPIQHQTRVARHDLDLDGKRVREGQRVLLMLGAANRDPARFDDPDRLDIRRKPRGHVAFGSGAHFCIGAPLARVEAQIAITTVLQKMAGLQIEGGPLVWRHDTSLRNPVSLPVRFEAA